MNRFVVIDGNAIIHRAFHALPPLTSKKGEIVNAVYGFFSMFLKILQDLKPSYIAVCFDRPKPTFRQELYVGYQAKRPKMADELVPQIQIIHDILDKAKISIFEIDGYEADDLIGTLAVQALRAEVAPLSGAPRLASPAAGSSRVSGLEVIIVSGDRDMLQLVNSHVKVLAPVVGITNMLLYDSQKVEEKYGIKPEQIIDYKALVGDPSDNYPGVSGIGPKTASKLILEYETLDGIYKHLDDIKKKNEALAVKLAEGAEAAGLAKKLATIVTDAPISLDIKKCSCSDFDTKSLLASFEDLGFKSLVKRVQNNGAVKEIKEEKKPENPQLGLL